MQYVSWNICWGNPSLWFYKNLILHLLNAVAKKSYVRNKLAWFQGLKKELITSYLCVRKSIQPVSNWPITNAFSFGHGSSKHSQQRVEHLWRRIPLGMRWNFKTWCKTLHSRDKWDFFLFFKAATWAMQLLSNVSEFHRFLLEMCRISLSEGEQKAAQREFAGGWNCFILARVLLKWPHAASFRFMLWYRAACASTTKRFPHVVLFCFPVNNHSGYCFSGLCYRWHQWFATACCLVMQHLQFGSVIARSRTETQTGGAVS